MKLQSIGILMAGGVWAACFLGELCNAQEGVQWESLSLRAAQQRAMQTRRLVLVHFWSPNCGPCQKMERLVFSRPDVAAAIETYYVPVKINADQYPYTARQYGITALPTDLVLSPNGQVVRRFQGAVPAEQYIAQLHQVATEMQLARPSSSPDANPIALNQGASFSGPPSENRPLWSHPNRQGALSPDLYGHTLPPPQNAPGGHSGGYQIPPYGHIGGQGGPIAHSPGIPGQGSSVPSRVPGDYLPSPPLAERTMSPPRGIGPSASLEGASSPYFPGNPAGNTPLTSHFSSPDMGGPTRYTPNSPTVPLPGSPRPEGRGMSSPSSGLMSSSSEGDAGGISSGSGNALAPQGGLSSSGFPAGERSPMVPETLGVKGTPGDKGQSGSGPPAESVLQDGWPPGLPPLGLEGYCPVELTEKRRWVLGTHPWGVIHRGRTYMCAGPEEQKKFLADPDRYAPVLAGQDIVQFVDRGLEVPGRREYGVFYRGQVYLFAEPASLDAFRKNPRRYLEAISRSPSPETASRR